MITISETITYFWVAANLTGIMLGVVWGLVLPERKK